MVRETKHMMWAKIRGIFVDDVVRGIIYEEGWSRAA